MFDFELSNPDYADIADKVRVDDEKRGLRIHLYEDTKESENQNKTDSKQNNNNKNSDEK